MTFASTQKRNSITFKLGDEELTENGGHQTIYQCSKLKRKLGFWKVQSMLQSWPLLCPPYKAVHLPGKVKLCRACKGTQAQLAFISLNFLQIAKLNLFFVFYLFLFMSFPNSQRCYGQIFFIKITYLF